MYKRIKLLAGIILLSAFSCKFLKTEQEDGKGELLARVYDSYLYKNDIKHIVPENLGGKDSATFVANYINVWAKNQLMVYKAEYNLQEDEKLFEEKIKNYRNDLLKYEYLQKYVKERLDTNVDQSEVKNYYITHSENYMLRENILQIRYLILPKDVPNLKKIEKLFKSNSPQDSSELRDLALSYARAFSPGDSTWFAFDQFSDIIPVQVFDQENFLKNKTYFKLEGDNDLIYLVDIMRYRTKENVSPLTYVYNIIENVIINKRRLALIDSLEKNLLRDAIKKQEFETYK
jgi:hypothetical protein